MSICLWIESSADPECGKPANHKVIVRGKLTKARVPLCDDHKAKHDENAAALRVETREDRRRERQTVVKFVPPNLTR